jgi:hypothetical protein
MKVFTVYFEAFGKHFKIQVKARNEDEAKLEVYKRISFIKFEPKELTDEASIHELLKEFLK